ncbi:glutamyl-tRNA reductase [Okibacterium fritillariae]|uniref:glutamyl-tRNA reductase n=1 Tax=Okibacterium fritillariae TaxID=123320 RepID=UPI0040556294
MLMCLTASHKNASFDLLEALSVRTDSVARRITEHTECVSGAVVVATCNRFEAYIDFDEPLTSAQAVALEATADAVAAASGIDAAILRQSLEVHSGQDAAEHLFAVAAGLESVVVGEGEIAGQVRRSLERAREEGTTSSDLERLFQRASQTSRGIKNRTPLGRAGRSIVRLALDLAESRISDWSATTVLLVGTGAYAGASLAALRDRGVTDVSVYSPSGRGARFATKHDMDNVSSTDFARLAASVDVIVTCTTANGHVIDAELLQRGRLEAHAASTDAAATVTPIGVVAAASGSAAAHAAATSGPNAGTDVIAGTGLSTGTGLDGAMLDAADGCPVDHDARAQLVIDMGLPRNVDPDVQTVRGVELLDLETIRIHAPLEELQATDEARKIVSRAARKFSDVTDEQSVSDAVVALRSHVFDLLEDEIQRAAGRGDDGETARALRHLTGVLLHTPTTRAKDFARAGEAQKYRDAIETLFGISVDGLASAAEDRAVADDAAARGEATA